MPCFYDATTVSPVVLDSDLIEVRHTVTGESVVALVRAMYRESPADSWTLVHVDGTDLADYVLIGTTVPDYLLSRIASAINSHNKRARALALAD